jgi:Uncharacterized protein conserved in bacteria
MKVHNKLLKSFLAVLAIFIMVLSAAGITIYSDSVFITENTSDIVKHIYTTKTDVFSILNDARVAYDANLDVITEEKEGNTRNISVQHRFVTTVAVDGNLLEYIALPTESVRDIAAAVGVNVGEDDLVNHSLDAGAFYGMNITINRVSKEEIVKTVEIPFESETRNTPLLKKGQTRIQSEGVTGIETSLFLETRIDGVLFSQDFLSRNITREPKNQIMLVGTGGTDMISTLAIPENLVLDENGIPVGAKAVYVGKSSAYSSSKVNVKGASGQRLQPGSVAVDPKVIPYGTLMYIRTTDGKYIYGVAVAADTGGFVHNGSGVLVDLFFGSNAEARQWGIKRVEVYVL